MINTDDFDHPKNTSQIEKKNNFNIKQLFSADATMIFFFIDQ